MATQLETRRPPRFVPSAAAAAVVVGADEQSASSASTVACRAIEGYGEGKK